MKPQITLVLSLALLAGCGKMQSQVSFEDENSKLVIEEPPPPPPPDEKPTCAPDAVDYELKTDLLAFEVNKEFSAHFGFNPIEEFLKAFKIKFKLKSGLMTFVMDLSKPQDPESVLAYAMGQGKFNKDEAGVEFSFANFDLGVGASYNTPLVTMINEGLSNSLLILKSKLANLPSDWATHVENVNGDIVRIPVGVVAGVREKDEFAIYEVKADWSEGPCKGHFISEYKTSNEPIAIGTVISVDETNNAFLQLHSIHGKVEVGARVEISKLVAGHTKLLKSIRLTSITSQPIELEDGQEKDLRPFISELIKPVIQNSGFYIRH